MSFLGSWDIDDVLRVHIQTSSVTTGAATDADAAPTWRVYEDDTATPVTTGSFSTLNSQTGFYVAAITLAAAIGYEIGKQYAIRSQATVGGVIGAQVDTFQIQSEVRLAAGAITAGTITAGALQGFTLGSVAGTVGSVAGTVGSVAAAVTVGSTSASAIATATQALALTIGSTSASAVATAVQALALTVGSTSASAIATAVQALALTISATSRAAIVDEVWDEAKADHTGAGTYGDLLDSTLSAIRAKTDLIFAGTGNSIAADIRYVNGVSVTGNGQSGTEWGPGS